MSLYGEAHNMGTPNDDQSNGQGQSPLGPAGLLVIGVLLLGLAVWSLWSAIHDGDLPHWLVFALVSVGGAGAVTAAVIVALDRRRPR